MRQLIGSLLLALALGLAPSSFGAVAIYPDPAPPDSATPIALTIASTVGGSCPLTEVRRTITGNIITIDALRAQRSCTTPVFFEYRFGVEIGTIPAGVYEVRVRLDGELIGTSRLTVRQAAPAFAVTPEVALPRDEVRITGDFLRCPFTPPVCATPRVRIGGVDAEVTAVDVASSSIVVRVPGSLEGPFDVTVVADTGTATVPVALYVREDTRVDGAFLEPVLFPVVYTAAGAFGSQWETALSLRNDNPFPLTTTANLFDDVLFGENDIRVPARTTVLRKGPIYTFPTGVVEYVPRQAAPGLFFGTVIRDLSRQAESFGTEVPVVRESELFDRPFDLLNVPVDGRYRVALRLYDIESGLVPAEAALPREVEVSFTSMTSNDVIASRIVPLQKADSLSLPAFAMISDLVAAVPELAGKGPLRVRVDPRAAPGQRTNWALVSVTNNTTQQVTLVSPQ